MKKYSKGNILATLLCMCMLAIPLSGCTQNKPSADNQTEAPQKVNYDYTGYEDYSEAGLDFTIKLPGEYLDNQTIIPGKYEVMFGDLSQLDAPKAETDPIDHMDIFFMPDKGQYCLFKVLAYSKEKWDGWMKSGKKAADLTGSVVSEEIFRKDGMVYIYTQPSTDISAFDTEMKADYGNLIKILPAIKASIKVTSNSVGDLGAFCARNFDGETIDNSIFAGHKLTMINIWATFCKPCIQELPDLQKMSTEMPEGTQLISIVGDVEDEASLELAKQIAKDMGVTFTSIIPDDALKQFLDQNMTAYPTTLFVDSNGKIVGEVIVGERDMSVYKEVLNDRLAVGS